MARLKAEGNGGGRAWWIRALVRVSLILFAATTLAVGAWWIRDRWLYQVPALAIRDISVEVDGVLSPEEVRRLSGIRPGRNILSVDLPGLRDRLQRHPRIAAARILIEFPGTLSIRVRERIPIASVEPLAGSGIRARYLLDETGHVIVPLVAGTSPEASRAAEDALPRILGRGSLSPDTDQDTLAALELLHEFERRPQGTLPEIVSVSVAVPGVLDVTTADGTAIRFGGERGTFDLQLRRWQDLRAHLVATGEKRVLRQLDLSVSQNAPIRWMETATDQPAPAAEPTARPRIRRIPRRTHV